MKQCIAPLVYAPPVTDDDDRYESAAAMLDFRNPEGDALDPAIWVPENAAGVVNFTWDISKALQRVGKHYRCNFGNSGIFRPGSGRASRRCQRTHGGRTIACFPIE